MSPWVCQPNSTFPESEAEGDGMDFLLRKVYRVLTDPSLGPRGVLALGCGLSAHPNPARWAGSGKTRCPARITRPASQRNWSGLRGRGLQVRGEGE